VPAAAEPVPNRLRAPSHARVPLAAVIRDQLTAALASALRGAGVDPPAEIPLEQPARREHGDWSSTVALAVAKRAGRKPRDLAEDLAAALRADLPAHVTAVELAGPGFVNFRLAPTWLHDVLRTVVAGGVDGGYAGAYIAEWAAEMPDDVDPLEWGRQRAVDDHRATLARMRIHFDTWFSERTMVASGAIARTLDDLRAAGVVYEGDGATWLRATDTEDDKDRVLVRSNGEVTYLLPDIAYHRDKYGRGFDRLIDVWGADHHGYVPRLRFALQALGHPADSFTVCIIQLVQLLRDGREVRLSKRTGEIITVDEMLDEIGADAARLTYLLQSVDSRQAFDLTLAAAQKNENPVFYVQYANARIHSLTRVAAEAGIVARPLEDVDLGPLTHERELDVLRSLAELPEVVDLAARELAPHKVTTWVRELAGAFHGFYHDCRVMGEGIDPATTQARMWLVEASRVGLAIGLDLLGVSAPETM